MLLFLVLKKLKVGLYFIETIWLKENVTAKNVKYLLYLLYLHIFIMYSYVYAYL